VDAAELSITHLSGADLADSAPLLLPGDPRELSFVAQAHGKHALAGLAGPPLQFSVAQTEGATVLAFTGARAVGVDVQCRKQGLALSEIAAEVFSDREHADLRSAAPQDRERCFFDIWARKEALLRRWGSAF